MGSTVIYRNPRSTLSNPKEEFPAIIVKQYADDRCDLTVFSNTGVRYVRGVQFSTDITSSHTWYWGKLPTQREVKVEKEIAPEPLDQGQEGSKVDEPSLANS